VLAAVLGMRRRAGRGRGRDDLGPGSGPGARLRTPNWLGCADPAQAAGLGPRSRSHPGSGMRVARVCSSRFRPPAETEEPP
jgi:hypothetical protein